MSPRDYYEQHQWLYNLLWSTSALHYGFWTAGTTSLAAAIENVNVVVAEKLDLGRADHVLDLGSGTGGTSIALARDVGCRVTGITISPRQLAQARRNAHQAGVADRVDFILGNFEFPLTLPSSSFSAVVAIEGFCYAHDKFQMLKNLRPLLSAGARVVIVDGFLATTTLTSDQQRLYNLCRRGWQVPSLITMNELQTMMTAAGFRDIQSADHTTEILPSSRRINRLGKFIVGPAWLLARLKVVSPLLYDNARCMIAQAKMFDRIAQYRIVTAVC